jgi:ribosome-binding factor A
VAESWFRQQAGPGLVRDHPNEIDFEMSSRRIAKVAEALRETVSTTVLFELKDPRVKNVTVLHTEVSPDLRSARVFVSVMGDEKVQSLAMHGLRSARGFIQSRIADRLELRYTPILKFVLDPGVKFSVQASSIIREALAREAAGHDANENAESDDEPIGEEGSPDDGLTDEHGADEHGAAGEREAEAGDADAAADQDETAAKTKF